MSDLIRRLREYVESTDYINAEPLCREAADRIEADESLLRQALEAMECSGMGVGKFNRINGACAALRARLDAPC